MKNNLYFKPFKQEILKKFLSFLTGITNINYLLFLTVLIISGFTILSNRHDEIDFSREPLTARSTGELPATKMLWFLMAKKDVRNSLKDFIYRDQDEIDIISS